MSDPNPNCVTINGTVVGADRRTIPTECHMPSVVLYGKDTCIAPRPNRERVREAIADYVLLMLGAPVINIELDQQQLAVAVDTAMKYFERYCTSNMYEYYSFRTEPYISRYRMPCDIGFISGVYYRADGGSESGSSNEILTGANQVPFGRVGSWQGGTFYRPGWGHMGEFVLYKQYDEMYRKVSSAIGGWEIVGDGDIILYPNPTSSLSVIVHYMPRKKDWQETHEWIQEYSLAMAKEMLGRIRSNISQIVSPGGGVTLDGPTLLQEAREDRRRLEEELITRWSDPLGISMY